MNPALAALALVTVGGAILAVTARDVRATVLGLLVVLLGAPAGRVGRAPLTHLPRCRRSGPGTGACCHDLQAVVHGTRVRFVRGDPGGGASRGAPHLPAVASSRSVSAARSRPRGRSRVR